VWMIHVDAGINDRPDDAPPRRTVSPGCSVCFDSGYGAIYERYSKPSFRTSEELAKHSGKSRDTPPAVLEEQRFSKDN
jgi:hypothetical protein